jgi:soluble epoxide hydrolase / lipid-phosphate phosphatase
MLFKTLSTAVLCALGVDLVVGTEVKAVNPELFPLEAADCSALHRPTNEIRNIKISEPSQSAIPLISYVLTNPVDIAYADINPEAEKTLLMVHGWPSLWHSWKYQIEEFKVSV